MLTLDPIKLLIVAVVALVVLGPDKLPAAARRTSSLLADLQRLRASIHQQVQEQVGDHPLVTDLSAVRNQLMGLRATADPRQALYRSIGLGHDGLPPDPAAPADPLGAGSPAGVAAHRGPSGAARMPADREVDVVGDPSQN